MFLTITFFLLFIIILGSLFSWHVGIGHGVVGFFFWLVYLVQYYLVEPSSLSCR